MTNCLTALDSSMEVLVIYNDFLALTSVTPAGVIFALPLQASPNFLHYKWLLRDVPR